MVGLRWSSEASGIVISLFNSTGLVGFRRMEIRAWGGLDSSRIQKGIEVLFLMEIFVSTL